ncbi:MAG: hypothetical protein ACE5HI_08835 [bacterium]
MKYMLAALVGFLALIAGLTPFVYVFLNLFGVIGPNDPADAGVVGFCLFLVAVLWVLMSIDYIAKLFNLPRG